MAKRMKLEKGHSKRVFTAGAQRIHPRNDVSRIMRGGIRL